MHLNSLGVEQGHSASVVGILPVLVVAPEGKVGLDAAHHLAHAVRLHQRLERHLGGGWGSLVGWMDGGIDGWAVGWLVMNGWMDG